MASMYMKIFGNEIAFMDYDAIMEKFYQWKENANFMQVRSEIVSKVAQFVFSLYIASIIWERKLIVASLKLFLTNSVQFFQPF